MRLLSISFLLIASLQCATANELDAKWQEASSALERKNYGEAIPHLEAWLRLAAQEDIDSTEGHYNLGYAYWERKQPGRAVYHLVRSVQLSSSPIHGWNVLREVSTIESELGIKESVFDRLDFQIAHLLSRNWILAFLTLGIWTLVALSLWRMGTGTRAYRYLKPLLALPALFLMIATIGFGAHAVLDDIAVLDRSGEPAPVYRSPSSETDGKLVDLPSGTVVALSQRTPPFRQVVHPVSGWVNEADLLSLAQK